jgi:hypothetical protein
MKTLLVKAAFGVGLLAAGSAYAEAPAGATAECKDGTYYSGTAHKGACRGHQGVKTWLDASSSAAATDTAAATSTAKKSKKAKTAAAAPAAPATPAKTTATATATATASASGGHTAMCKDGTYFDGKTHKGACRGHKGVQEWLDKPAAATTAAPSASAAAAPAPTAAPTPAPAPAPKAASTEHKMPTPASEMTQKAGGGPGLVWVNSESKVYHCQGDEWYGKTKQGSYMSEADAKAKGYHGDHGKSCS